MATNLYEHRTRNKPIYDLFLDNSIIRTALKVANKPFCNKMAECRLKPIFIVGPARSGTTLIYQYIVYSLRVCFITNLMNRYPEGAVVLWRALGRFGARDNHFNNTLGRTAGINGPSQGITFWEILYQNRVENATGFISNCIESMQHYSECPFVSKWQGHNPNIKLLKSLFRSPVFLHITRNAGDTALSVHENWKRIGNDEHSPLSKPTRSYHKVARTDLFHNACAYVAAAQRDLDTDLADLPNSYGMSYEKFCANPGNEIQRFMNWYIADGGALQTRRPGGLEEIESFEVKRYPEVDVNRYQEKISEIDNELGMGR